MDLSDVCARLDARLHTDEYADVDASANGLQVGPPETDVARVAFAVDGVAATFDAAAERDADLLVVHHGISWGGFDRVTGQTYDRIAALVDADVALYVSHLPLDGHETLGNAAGVADLLGLDDRRPFGSMGPVTVGQRGRSDPVALADVVDVLETELDTGSGPVRVLDFGPDEVTDVAIVTGSGTDWIGEARAADVDLLVTGEGKGKAYHEAREAGLNVVLAGHYATETFGVRALQDVVTDWGLETTFVDHPTGL